MRYRILAPICAALLAAGSANAQDDSHEVIDAQVYPSMPYPVAAPGPPQLVAGQPACDDHRHGYGPHTGASLGGALIPYHRPMLPAPTTFYGYFNSPPEHLHLWDSYPQEVALRHWHRATKGQHARGGAGHPHAQPCH